MVRQLLWSSQFPKVGKLERPRMWPITSQYSICLQKLMGLRERATLAKAKTGFGDGKPHDK